MASKKLISKNDNISEKENSNAPPEPISEAYQAKDESTENLLSGLEAQAESEDIRSGQPSTDISISTNKLKSTKKRTNKQ